MCGIVGFKDKGLFDAVFPKLAHRGRDFSKSEQIGDWWIGHHLHAIVDFVPQPLVEGKNWLVANCEIYNWRELAKKHSINAKNDADLLFKLLLEKGESALDELRGPYAFAFWNGKLMLARDPAGVFPLFYSEDGFASERFPGSRELHPRHIFFGSLKYRGWAPSKGHSLEELESALKEAVRLRVHGDLTLFLSGIDSALLAVYLQDAGARFNSVTVGLEGSKDLESGKQFASRLNLDWQAVEVSKKEVHDAVPLVAEAIHSRNPIKIEVGLVTWFASQHAGKVAISGLGADELFGGYARMHRSPHKEQFWALRNIYERSTYRDNVIGLKWGTEIRLPYLDAEVVSIARGLNDSLLVNKKAVRELVRYYLNKLADLPKKAAQYGAGFSKLLGRPKNFTGPNDRNLGALLSGGKDSWQAMRIAKRLGYSVKVGVVIQPKEDSWMFHVPGIEKVPELVKQEGLRVIVQKTKGEKEKELEDLRTVLKKASGFVEGIVVGAISSEYQRDRVERICDELGLSCHAPLWGVNPEAYLRNVSRELRFKIVEVAANGLGREWVGEEVTPELAEKLIQLSKKYKFNPAGEGGEYETQIILD